MRTEMAWKLLQCVAIPDSLRLQHVEWSGEYSHRKAISYKIDGLQAKGGRTMPTVVGIFTSQAAAECAAERLCTLGIAREHRNFLIPGASNAQLEQVPTTEAEQPGMGAAIGSKGKTPGLTLSAYP